ncbi:MAG: flagellar protein FlaG [Dehalococcoidales bacterium]|nr:flagellar protein FlaG [Dehalococcoidales bacterium]
MTTDGTLKSVSAIEAIGEPSAGLRAWELWLAQGAEDAGVGRSARTPGATSGVGAQFNLVDTRLSFEEDEETGKTLIKVNDAKTGEVLRQVPPEELLRLAAVLQRQMGLLVDKRR